MLVALVIPAHNRNARAWAVLIPIGVVLAMWGIARQTFFRGGGLNVFFDLLSMCIIFLAVYLLVLPYFWRKRGIVRLGYAFAIALGLLLVHISGMGGKWSMSSNSIVVPVYFSIWFGATVLALLLTRLRMGAQLSGARFGWYLLMFYLLSTMALSMLLGLILFATTHLGGIFAAISIAGAVFGLVFYIIAAPFAVLMFKNGLFKERLAECMGIVLEKPEEFGPDPKIY
ncbi:MAG: hypothetical protein A2Y07_04275 [Planctomycetes bacterium GWF2_50_10]|nr:MAG: hypothetical protein A2Y07_04275 [Planctomycetes bacterium GWF2_50_10]